MKGMITVEYPKSLADSLRLTGKGFEDEVKTSSLVKLFEMGKVSSGVAANVLGLTRIEFLDVLAKYQVSVFEPSDLNEFSEDIANAKSSL